MALPVDPTLALGTLQTLARYQGSREDPLTEEQPGRILHEVRLGAEGALALGGGRAYYGTADATPLFVALLGELHRCGLPETEVAAFLLAADRALEWIDTYGDPNGDGFVEYRRATDRGLVNQGWKDSFDGINRGRRTLAAPPIALADVQAHVYAAYTARVELADALGDQARAPALAEAGGGPQGGVQRAVWMPRWQAYAVALDGAGGPGRRHHVEHGPLSVVRQHRRGQGPGGRPALARAAAVDRFRCAHAGRRHGRLQPR